VSRVPATSRRGFLKLGLFASAAAVALATIQKFGPAPGRYENLLGAERPRLLSRKAFATLTLFTMDVVGAAPDAVTVQQTRTAARIDLELSIVGGKLAADIRAALALLEHGPLLNGELARYSTLPAAQRTAYLRRLQTGGNVTLRSVYNGLRFLAIFFYYSDDNTWPRLGYRGPWVPEKVFVGGNRIANLDART